MIFKHGYLNTGLLINNNKIGSYARENYGQNKISYSFRYNIMMNIWSFKIKKEKISKEKKKFNKKLNTYLLISYLFNCLFTTKITGLW